LFVEPTYARNKAKSVNEHNCKANTLKVNAADLMNKK